MTFKLTYSTMFSPPAELHEQFESALAKLPGLATRRAHRLIPLSRNLADCDTNSPIRISLILVESSNLRIVGAHHDEAVQVAVRIYRDILWEIQLGTGSRTAIPKIFSSASHGGDHSA